jgi:trk system potassium uptake protein TrkA
MKVVIVGGGNVGYTSAEALCKIHDVLIIEKDTVKADNIKSLLNVSVLHEDGSNPKVLKAGIERMEADIIFAALPDDGLNLFIGMIAKRIKPSIKTVACLRNPDYEIKTDSEGIDIIISPEQIMANKISKIASLENVVQYDYLDNIGAAVVTFKVEKDHDIIGKVVMDINIPDNCTIVAIYRGDNVILDTETAQIHVDDRICMMGSIEAVEQFNRLMGIEKETREYVIIGATVSGIAIAKALSTSGKRRFIKIIDKDEMNCRNASRALSDAIVVNADIADPLIMSGENIDRADVIISVSPMDERNLLVCMAALKFGTRKIITKYSTEEYEEIFKYAGIESIIGYHRVISNEITKNLTYEENVLLTLDHENETLFGTLVDKKSAFVDRCLGDLKLPDGVCPVAVIRNGELIYPKMNTIFRIGDKVLIFTYNVNTVKLSKFIGHDTPLEM